MLATSYKGAITTQVIREAELLAGLYARRIRIDKPWRLPFNVLVRLVYDGEVRASGWLGSRHGSGAAAGHEAEMRVVIVHQLVVVNGDDQRQRQQPACYCSPASHPSAASVNAEEHTTSKCSI